MATSDPRIYLVKTLNGVAPSCDINARQRDIKYEVLEFVAFHFPAPIFLPSLFAQALSELRFRSRKHHTLSDGLGGPSYMLRTVTFNAVRRAADREASFPSSSLQKQR